MSKQPFAIQTITDNLFFTILKVVISGEIDTPTLLIDSDSLIGASLSSAIEQFGGGYPNLPDIHCLSSNTNRNKCNPCQLGNKSQENLIGISQNTINVSANLVNTQNTPLGHQFVSPEVITTNDLVTFIPPGLNQNFLGLPVSNTNFESFNNLPILSGMTGNTSHISYLLIGGNSINEILEILNNDNNNLNGNWKLEYDNQYRFYYNSLSVNSISVNNNSLSKNEILDLLSSVNFNGHLGEWQQTIGNNYSFKKKNIKLCNITVSGENLGLNSLIQILNNIPINNQYGTWLPIKNSLAPDGGTVLSSTPLNNGAYQFGFNMASNNIITNIISFQEKITKYNWILTKLVNGIYTYTKKSSNQSDLNYLINITPTQQRISIVGNKYSITELLGDISDLGLQISPTTTWRQSLADINIRLINNNPPTFDIIGNCNILPEMLDKLSNILSVKSSISNIKSITLNNIDNLDLLLLPNWKWENKYTLLTNGTNQLILEKNNDKYILTGNINIVNKIQNNILIPNNIIFSDTEDKQSSFIKIQSTNDVINNNTQTEIQGDIKTLQEISNAFPEIFTKPNPLKLQVITINSNYYNFINTLNQDWELSYSNNTSSEFIDRRVRGISFEVYNTSCNLITVWGTSLSIDFLKEYFRNSPIFYNITEDIPSNKYVNIFTLNDNILDCPDVEKTYQIIGNLDVLTAIKNSKCLLQTDIVYSAITIQTNTINLINILENFDYGIGNLGWKRESIDSGCENNSNMYRFYKLGNQGSEKPTPYFIYIYTIGEYTKIEGLQLGILQLIIPVLENNRINFIKSGDPPQIQNNPNGNQINMTIGKVTGLTGNIKKLPSCDAPTRLAITNINWTLTNNSNNYIELLWETDPSIDDNFFTNNSDITGETAFIFSDTGSYGMGSLNSGNGNTLVDGGGQPGIPNNAFPNPTGNLLFRTKGNVNGTFTIKLVKYSGYYNTINFFDNAANNLQSAIQANELIHRDWIRQVKQNYEESWLIPQLISAEAASHIMLRPGGGTNGQITFGVKGVITFSIPINNISKQFSRIWSGSILRTIDPNFRSSPEGKFYINTITPIILGFNKILTSISGPLTNNGDSINVNLTNNKIDPLKKQRNLEFEYQIGLGLAQQNSIQLGLNNNPLFIATNNIVQNILKLNDNIPFIKETLCPGIKYNGNTQETDFYRSFYGEVEESKCLTNINNFNITSEINLSVINNTTSRIRLDYSNIYGNFFFEEALLKILENSERNTNSTIRIGQNSTGPDSFGALQQIGGINTANYSRWEETQVKRLLYGSEFPIHINLPTKDKPYFTFDDGSRVDGIVYNALATGINIPVNERPPFIFPGENKDFQGNNISSNLITGIANGNFVGNPQINSNQDARDISELFNNGYYNNSDLVNYQPRQLVPRLFQYNLNNQNINTISQNTNYSNTNVRKQDSRFLGFNTTTYRL